MGQAAQARGSARGEAIDLGAVAAHAGALERAANRARQARPVVEAEGARTAGVRAAARGLAGMPPPVMEAPPRKAGWQR